MRLIFTPALTHVLATTRLGENELHGAHRDRSFLPIDELPPDDALALIESYQPDGRFRSEAERDAAREIVRLLGSFTLAVESAAVYLGQFANDVTCAAFLARLKKEGLEGLDTAASQSSEGMLHGEKRLSATLQPTLERLGAAEKLALEFAALLPPDQMPLPWLRALVAQTFPEMERDAEPGYPDPWKNVLRCLFSLRLIQATDAIDAEGQPLVVRVHRLVQQLMLRDCSSSERAGLQQAVDALTKQRVAALGQTSQWEDVRWEIDPLDALANMWADAKHPLAAWLLNQIALRWFTLMELKRAEPLMRQALAIDEHDFGPEHPSIAIRLNNLGFLLQTTNRLAEAEPLLRRTLAISEATDHAETASALNNLALWSRASNRLAEAESLLRRALAIKEADLDADHPKVAEILNNLAQLLQETNRLGEAESLMRRVLAIDETNYGVQHSRVATDLNNLALLLQATSRLTDAEPFLRRALAIDEGNYGLDHPDVARDLNNLALLFQDTNRRIEAEPLHRRALAILESKFGPNHPLVATQLNNLALLLRNMNRLVEAEPLYRRALAIDEANCVPSHPRIATRLNNLAALLQATSRLAEAEPLMRRALTICEQGLGSEHPNVAGALSNLASLLQETGRVAEAKPLMRRVLKILLKFTHATGHHHPYLQDAINNYTALLSQMGRSPAEVQAQLNTVARPYGFQFDGPSQRYKL